MRAAGRAEARYYPTLRPADRRHPVNIQHVRAHWDDILRTASSIKQGTVTRLADAAQARQLPAPERTGRWPLRNGPVRHTFTVHHGLAAKC